MPAPQALFREEIEVDLGKSSVTDLHLAPRVLVDVAGEVRCTWATVLSPRPAGLSLKRDGVELFMRSEIQISPFHFGWSSACAVTAPHGAQPAQATLVYEPRLQAGPLRSAVVWLRSEYSELGRVQLHFRCKMAGGSSAWIAWPRGNAGFRPTLELRVEEGFTAFEVRARLEQPQSPGLRASVMHLVGTFCGGHILTDPCCFAFVGSADVERARLPDGEGEWSAEGRIRLRAHVVEADAGVALPAVTDIDPQPLLTGRPEGPRLGGQLALISDLDGDGTPEIAVADASGPQQTASHLWILDGRTGRVVRPHKGGPIASWRAAALGDGDGDGTGDYVITDSASDASQYRAGAAWRVSGRSGKLDEILHLLPQDLRRLHGDVEFGVALLSAGDIDEDGIDDALVSAPCCDSVVDNTGRVVGLRGTFARSGPDRLLDLGVTGRSAGDRITAVAAGRDVNGDAVPDFVTWRRGGERNHAFGTLQVHSGRSGTLLTGAVTLESGSTVAAAFGGEVGTGEVQVVAMAVERIRDRSQPDDGPREPGFVTAISARDGKRPWTKPLPRGLVPLGSLVAIGDRDGDGWHDFALGFAESNGPGKRGGVLFVSGRDGAFLGHSLGPDGDERFAHELAFWPGDPDALLVGSHRAEKACGSVYRCRLPR